MRNILLIGISLVLLTAGMALAVDDATLQEVENKAESANAKADGKYVYKPYIIRNLQDSNVGAQVTSEGQIYVIGLKKLNEFRNIEIELQLDIQKISEDKAPFNMFFVDPAQLEVLAQDGYVPDLYTYEIIGFHNNRAITAYEKIGKFSLGEYDLDINIKKISKFDGRVTMNINGESFKGEDYSFGHFSQFGSWGILIIAGPDTKISKFNLKTETLEFEE
ncbi:MAG: hypothetical protein QNK14_02335 [Desulfobacterales bacterium]|nr:hypothetical protein [Desulfobacterales bacterium]